MKTQLTHTNDSLRATEFAVKHPGWHSYAKDKQTDRAIERAKFLGKVETNKFRQFRSIEVGPAKLTQNQFAAIYPVNPDPERNGVWKTSWIATTAAGERSTANAKLIAAAPDLLEALKNLLCYVEADSDDYQEREDCATAVAAITKAGGGQ